MNTAKKSSESGTWRVSVRLDARRATILRTFSEQNNSDPSTVIRSALDRLEVLSDNTRLSSIVQLQSTTEASDGCSSQAAGQTLSNLMSAEAEGGSRRTSTAPRSNPENLKDMFTRYKAFGSELGTVRKRLFKSLFCTALLIHQRSNNPKERELHNDLFRIGKDHGLFN